MQLRWAAYELELMHHSVSQALPLIPNNVAKASWHYKGNFAIGSKNEERVEMHWLVFTSSGISVMFCTFQIYEEECLLDESSKTNSKQAKSV